MGTHSVNKFNDGQEKRQFTRHLLNDIKALQYMLDHDMIETGIARIGAEQELVLVDKNFHPSMNNMDILDKVKDEHYTTEIAKFNLEINLDPEKFDGHCFRKMENKLQQLLRKGVKVAEKLDTNILLTGILPTLHREHLQFDHMTPNVRYEALNDVMRWQKGTDFELNIEGIDELITKHPNILFEACNTSFQVHLQIDPNDFVDMYNWAQLIAGPVLSVCSNSPLLLGRRLWNETRIALFQQSVDTRNASNLKREKEPRVGFGKAWLKDSVVELFKDNVSRFNLLFASDKTEDSMEVLESGKIPELEALKLHNGTVYKWNRPCYGVGGGKPHLRIENRYLPSGPTVRDEMANAALWLGMMAGLPDEYRDLASKMEFEEVRFNFFNAARRSIDCQFNWFGKMISARKLLERELLPIAIKGMEKMKVSKDDINEYIRVIEGRLRKNVTGSIWTTKNFTELLKESTPSEASVNITKMMYDNQWSGKPVHQWKNIDPGKRDHVKEFKRVGQIMESDLFTVHEDDLLDLVVNVMEWQNIRHVPVENDAHEMVGMIDARCLIRYFNSKTDKDEMSAKDIMNTDYPTVGVDTSTADAVQLMGEKRSDALAVLSDDNKLVGIVTESDIIQVLRYTKRLSKED